MLYCHLCEQYKDESLFHPAGVACRQCEDENIVFRLKTEPEYRAGYLEGMRKAYSGYQYDGGKAEFLRWALEIHGPAIWNELFQYKRSSHPVSLKGLTREDGRRMGGGLK